MAVPEPSAVLSVDLAAHAAYADAGVASAAVLKYLHGAVGFRFWAVTRVIGQTCQIVATGPEQFPATAGERFPWSVALCRQVLLGQAPRVALDVQTVPAYRELALVQQWQIGAYLSSPLTVDGPRCTALCARSTRSRSRLPQPVQRSWWIWWTGRPG